MSYFQNKNTSAYAITFGLVGMTALVAIIANGIVEHKQEENGAKISKEVVLEMSQNNSNTSSSSNNSTNTDSNSNNSGSMMSNMNNCKNGTYSSTQTYTVQGTKDTVKTTLQIQDDTIQNMEIVWVSGNRESQNWINSYTSLVSTKIEGKKLDDIQSAMVSGSTLTSNAFTSSLIDIKSQAKIN